MQRNAASAPSRQLAAPARPAQLQHRARQCAGGTSQPPSPKLDRILAHTRRKLINEGLNVECVVQMSEGSPVTDWHAHPGGQVLNVLAWKPTCRSHASCLLRAARPTAPRRPVSRPAWGRGVERRTSFWQPHVNPEARASIDAMPRSEMGPGVHTALPMLAAEELDAPRPSASRFGSSRTAGPAPRSRRSAGHAACRGIPGLRSCGSVCLQRCPPEPRRNARAVPTCTVQAPHAHDGHEIRLRCCGPGGRAAPTAAASRAPHPRSRPSR